MTVSPLLFAVIAFSVIAFTLLVVQVFVSTKAKSRSGYKGGAAGSERYYQIIPTRDTTRRLTNAIGTIDDRVPYSFQLESPNNNVVDTLKISGRSDDINTWWAVVQDPAGTQAYRFRSLITGNYVSFEREETYTRYGVRLFQYVTVDDPILGNPSVDGTGWFYLLKTTPLRAGLGFRYRIKCVEPENFFLVSALTWPGRNFEPYEHYWYQTPTNTSPVRRPIHPRSVHISEFGNEDFFLQKDIRLTGQLLAELS